MPISAYKVTLICMEPSRPSAVAAIIDTMNAEQGMPVRIAFRGFESAMLTDPRTRAEIGEAIGGSDLVIISHVLLDDEVAALEQLVRDRTPGEATIVALSSAGALMRLTRMGRFRFAQRTSEPEREPRGRSSGGIRELLRKIAGDHDTGRYLKELMILAPKILRLLPGRMQDLRSYLESYLYFIECSDHNVRSMFLMLADRYHAPLKGRLAGRYAAPVVYPSEGIYHPDAPEVFSSRDAYLAWYRAQKPGLAESALVGVIILRGDVLMGETVHIATAIHALESRGLGVIPAFSSSFDYRVAVERMMLRPEGGGIEALVSLTAFPLVGGHVRSDIPEATSALKRYGVPYFAPVPLLFQTLEEWNESDYGLAPIQTALHVALPELEGAIEPIVASAVTMTSSGKVKIGIEERCERLARRVERWITLRREQNAAKRIAITLFAFPPNKGAVGTAAYLDVFRSLHNTLTRLKDEGYTVELPASPEEMIEHIIAGDDRLAVQTSADLHVAARMTTTQYTELAPGAARASVAWGPPPGTIGSDGRDLLIHGRIYGNIFVGVQPSFGYEGDPMRLLFSRSAAPHHGFIAYYTWIERVFGADAHLHFGTHGALEFMPGRQVGLGATCWPDLLTSELPNIYLYSINNPSEGTIAKRRSLATLVSYMTPPLENAGLYRELGMLKNMVDDYRTSPPGDSRRELVFQALVEKVEECRFSIDDFRLNQSTSPNSLSPHDVSLALAGTDSMDIPPEAADAFVGRLHGILAEIESRLIPTGLHVVGEIPGNEELADLLFAVSEYDRPERNIRALTGIIAEAFGETYPELYGRAESGDDTAIERYAVVRRLARTGITELLAISGSNGNRPDSRTAPETAAAAIIRSAPELRSRQRELRAALTWLHEMAGRAQERHELDALVTALSGGYIMPGIGADTVRNPEALPSGRNIHALDPTAIPSPVAVRNGERVARMMLQKHVEETGGYPESIGMILWGLDNIKTQGEAIAQAFALVGVRPEPNALGRVTRLRVIPLEELGRPRIDVTVQASGIFRDIFGLQMELLDEAFRMVAALDEPEHLNFVRKRSRELAARLGISEHEASTRVFSNAAGSYGTNIDHAVSMSSWESQDDLAEIFLRRKTFAYGKGFNSRESRDIFEELASGIDATFQNLDSSEVGITDVDHYFEYLGGLTNVVERRRGRRPLPLVADTTTARAKVRTLEATIRLEVRTKLLNPKWFEGMLRHGYQGVEEIRKRLDYTFGFSATANAVDGWVYDQVHDTYVADEELRATMQRLNLDAYAGLVRRLAEAEERGFWRPEPERMSLLREVHDTLEDRLEGIE